MDLTTGDFLSRNWNTIRAAHELERLRPAEIIFPAEAVALRDLLRGAFQILNPYEDWVFAPETALFTVRDHFKVASLDGFGLKDGAPPLARRAGRFIISPSICAGM